MGRTKGHLHARGAPARIVDFLSAELRWISAQAIAEFMEDKHGINHNTARKALERLEQNGYVEKRLVPNFKYRDGYYQAEYRSDYWAAG